MAEALARARRHGRAALAEAAAAARALLDAASLATSGAPAERSAAALAHLLDAIVDWLDPRSGSASPVLGVVIEALDAEIARWEGLGRDDADARAVLRAFLAVRELLWELGVRPSGVHDERGEQPEGATRRVQRVPLQG
ncbi:MAG TPA: hypothetical protein VMS76_00260 [Planctomycetota bacterium]|nr:hypothetical protein [Planctomycetota bacterium]